MKTRDNPESRPSSDGFGGEDRQYLTGVVRQARATDMERHTLTARKLLTAYRRGDRSFRHVVVEDAALDGAELEGVELWGADLRGATLSNATLVSASLQRATLDGATLHQANLSRANLWRASMRGANASRTILDTAVLEGADLTEADLSGASMDGTTLSAANLSGATLRGAILWRTALDGVVLNGADLSHAHLVDVQLPDSIHDAANLTGTTLDWRTIAHSRHRPGLVDLLTRMGMPALPATYLIDALHAIDTVNLSTMLRSVFLAHDQIARPFAQALRTDLTGHGIKNWYAATSARSGGYERMVLCCNRSLLSNPAVAEEIAAVLKRETPDGPAILLPVALDDVLDSAAGPPQGWPLPLTEVYHTVRKRVIADFRNTDEGSEAWGVAVLSVLEALRT